MSVQLAQTPDQYALTKGGRMLYRFTGSGRYETRGTKAVNVLIIGGAVTAGKQIVLRWNGQSHTLIARANATGNGDFPAGSGGDPYIEQLVAYFKRYFAFREDFTVSRDTESNFGYAIVLTAKQPGAAYTMSLVSITPATQFESLGVENRVVGTDPRIRERYGVYAELLLQRAGTAGTDLDAHFERIASSHVECDEDGVAEYDAGDVLHSYLSADLPNDSAQTALTSHRKYYLVYAEAFGQFVRPGLIIQDTIRHAYLGGADFEHRSGVGFSLETFVRGANPNDDRALRFGGTARRIYVDEPAWLSFVNLRDDAPEAVSLDVYLKFDDQTTTNAPVATYEAFPAGQKLTYAVGITQRNLLALVPAGRYLTEYYVKLRSSSQDYSRQYRFVVDYDRRPYRRSFAYLNSLGAFDGITTWGKGSAELLRFYDQAERSLPSHYQPTAAQFVDYNIARQQQVEVASGWQPQTELERWNDFYGSSVRLRATTKGLLAISLSSKSIRQAKDGDTQFAHLFSYVYLHRDVFYTDDETPATDETIAPVAVPGGSVTVQPVVTVLTRDPTINNALRDLTADDVARIKLWLARPNPETLGFLTEDIGSEVFRHRDVPIRWPELTDKPTTRDQAGLTDVPTKNETLLQAFQLQKITPKIKIWTGPTEPN